MPALSWIVLILCVHILSASVGPTKSQHTALPSLPPALMLRRKPHDRLNLGHSSTPLVPEMTSSKSSQIDPGDDEYKEFTHSHSVRRLAGWIGLSSDATFHLCSVLNFLLMLALIYWKGYPRITVALRARSSLILRTIEEAERLSEEAQRRLAEIESRWLSSIPRSRRYKLPRKLEWKMRGRLCWRQLLKILAGFWNTQNTKSCWPPNAHDANRRHLPRI
jgi:hypothetical protein